MTHTQAVSQDIRRHPNVSRSSSEKWATSLSGFCIGAAWCSTPGAQALHAKKESTMKAPVRLHAAEPATAEANIFVVAKLGGGESPRSGIAGAAVEPHARLPARPGGCGIRPTAGVGRALSSRGWLELRVAVGRLPRLKLNAKAQSAPSQGRDAMQSERNPL